MKEWLVTITPPGKAITCAETWVLPGDQLEIDAVARGVVAFRDALAKLRRKLMLTKLEVLTGINLWIVHA